MDRYKETFETWDKVASLYEERFMDLDLYDQTYDLICSSVRDKNAKILEIGCGPGNITKYLLNKRPDFEIFGIDISPNMIKLAKKNNPTAKFKVMDSREISMLKTKYNVIICGFCLPYLSENDCEKLILDFAQRVNGDGLVYISFMEGNANQSGFQASSTGDRVYFYYHELKKLNAQLHSNGFEALKTFKVPYTRADLTKEIHTIVIAKKS